MLGLSSLLTLALCASPAAACPSAPPQDPAAEVVARTRWLPGTILPLEPRMVPVMAQPPEGIDAPPGIKVAEYAQIEFGDQQVCVVTLDAFPDKEGLWIDDKLDGHFRNDARVLWKQGAVKWKLSHKIAVPYAQEPRAISIPLQFEISKLKKDELGVTAEVYKAGEVQLQDRVHSFVVVDLNSTLQFDAEEGIVMLFDLNSDGRFQAEEGSSEYFRAGESFSLGGTSYRFVVRDPAGAEVAFRPTGEARKASRIAWIAEEAPPTGVVVDPVEESFETLKQRLDDAIDLGRGKMAPTAEAIGTLGTEEAFVYLDKIARSKKNKTLLRSKAVEALGQEAYLEYGAKVKRFALDKEPAIAKAGIKALHAMGWPEREEVYAKQSGNRNDAIARAAAIHLGYLTTPSAVETVSKLIANSKTEREVRLGAYQSLRTHPEGPPLSGMLAAASAEYPPLAALGLEDLFLLDPMAAAELARDAAAQREHSSAQYEAIIRVLGSVADGPSIRSLLEMDTKGKAVPRSQIRKLLGTLRDPAVVPTIAESFGSREVSERQLAASVLGRITLAESATALAEQLGVEKDEDVELTILEALGRLPFPQSIEALIKLAKQNGTNHVLAVQALGAVGYGDEGARAYLTELLSTSEWQSRIPAIQAAAKTGDSALGEQMLLSLSHEEWPVRLAAIEGLAHLRDKRWIGPLITHLDQEPRLRLRLALGQTLFQLTGQSAYWDADTWKAWWERAESGFQVSPTPPEPPENTGGDTVVGTFYGLRLESDSVIFVIDKSGSMQALGNPGTGDQARTRNRLVEAVDEVFTAAAGLADEDQINVIMFSSGVRAWKKSLSALSERNRENLSGFLKKQRPDGGTNVFDALEEAILTDGVDKILLLSDGEPTEGRFIAQEDILREVRKLNATKRIAIDTISLGGESRLLRLLAEENEGTYISR